MLLLREQILPPPPPPPPPKKIMTLCVIGRVRLERYCGKMYSRHLFSVRQINDDIYLHYTEKPERNSNQQE